MQSSSRLSRNDGSTSLGCPTLLAAVLTALGFGTTDNVAETCHQALIAANVAVSRWQYKVVDAKALSD
jgi:hypothetical protein